MIRPIRSPSDSANQRLPSGPAAIPRGPAARGDAGAELRDGAGRGDPPDPVAVELGEPEVAVRAGGDAVRAAPAVMPAVNSVTVPAGVIRPIRSPSNSVNQRLPSGPAAMPFGRRVGGDARAELGDGAGGGDPPDPVAEELGEPQVAVRPGGDSVWDGGRRDAGAELGSRPRGERSGRKRDQQPGRQHRNRIPPQLCPHVHTPRLRPPGVAAGTSPTLTLIAPLRHVCEATTERRWNRTIQAGAAPPCRF